MGRSPLLPRPTDPYPTRYARVIVCVTVLPSRSAVDARSDANAPAG
ncbi:hypothetical protein [Actinophytocola sp.]